MTKIIKFPKRSKAYSDKFLRTVKPDVIGDFIKEANPHLTLKAADAMALAIIYSTYLQLVFEEEGQTIVPFDEVEQYIWAAHDKRRYTKKKKSVKDKDTTDIPYTKVRVEWVDCVSDSAWASDKEFKNMKLATPVNEGWIFSKDRKSIKLFASYDKEDDGTITFGDRTMIPKSWIVKITEI